MHGDTEEAPRPPQMSCSPDEWVYTPRVGSTNTTSGATGATIIVPQTPLICRERAPVHLCSEKEKTAGCKLKKPIAVVAGCKGLVCNTIQ
jgi:hypothetical protein